MAQTCSRCFAANPDEAVFCYRDGALLQNRVPGPDTDIGGRAPFPTPFMFPSGQVCRNFDQLVLACQADWNAGIQVLGSGQLARFFRSIGRLDLEFNANSAARAGDLSHGLHNLLETLPSDALPPPRVEVPAEIVLPALQVGQDHSFSLRLVNAGGRLLFGSVETECPWLSLGGPGVVTRKAFQFQNELTMPVRVCGKALRACPVLKGLLHVASNGGEAAVEVRLPVPAKPFAHPGVLAGVAKLGDLIAAAAAAPYEAARFFDDDSVRQWYETNGWDYPIQGPTAAGVDGVRQFFHALHLDDPLAGLPPPPPAPRVIQLRGVAGTALGHRLEIRGRARGIRPVSVAATSDQPWLGIGATHVNDLATVDLVVPSIPNRPGETLHARVTLTLNDTYRRVLPVTLAVTVPPAGRPGSVP
jgi:hypothetical protein